VSTRCSLGCARGYTWRHGSGCGGMCVGARPGFFRGACALTHVDMGVGLGVCVCVWTYLRAHTGISMYYHVCVCTCTLVWNIFIQRDLRGLRFYWSKCATVIEGWGKRPTRTHADSHMRVCVRVEMCAWSWFRAHTHAQDANAHQMYVCSCWCNACSRVREPGMGQSLLAEMLAKEFPKVKPDKWGCVQACQLWYVHREDCLYYCS